MANVRSYNIFSDIQKRSDAGFVYMDSNGNLYKPEALRRAFFKEYSEQVREMSIDPIETPYYDYEGEKMKDFITLDEVQEIIMDAFEAEQPTENEEGQNEKYAKILHAPRS
uniref:Uncharacterized protein n=1 Tax=Tectiviridae sp. cthzn51 TaxID=2826821 RepID=A0A8S5LUS0_9VIRU|nr:MAG TPA: hypothetical protein [Tectiviridae sp. cthzn51]